MAKRLRYCPNCKMPIRTADGVCPTPECVRLARKNAEEPEEFGFDEKAASAKRACGGGQRVIRSAKPFS